MPHSSKETKIGWFNQSELFYPSNVVWHNPLSTTIYLKTKDSRVNNVSSRSAHEAWLKHSGAHQIYGLVNWPHTLRTYRQYACHLALCWNLEATKYIQDSSTTLLHIKKPILLIKTNLCLVLFVQMVGTNCYIARNQNNLIICNMNFYLSPFYNTTTPLLLERWSCGTESIKSFYANHSYKKPRGVSRDARRSTVQYSFCRVRIFPMLPLRWNPACL